MKVFNDNRVLPAADINEYLVNVKYSDKAAGTSRASTTTVADDPDLQIVLDTNKTYRLQIIAPYNSPAAAGFTYKIGAPGGSVFTGYAITAVGGTVSIITYSAAGLSYTSAVNLGATRRPAHHP